ncbi:MAG: SHOCT domain-containing protein [Theionarchaea archaeon]|nr:SHOCT domain-containing protein [Theionarchaea archaeon]
MEKLPPLEARQAEKPSESRPSDLTTLRLQLARGEITLEEFESKKAELEKY